MHREDLQKILAGFGFAETLNKTLEGLNITHVIHFSERLRKLVEYYVDPVGIIKSVWGIWDNGAEIMENLPDIELWLNNGGVTE